MSFEDLKREVQAGLDVRNNGIPMGFDRLNKYIGIRKSMYTLVRSEEHTSELQSH